MGIARCVHCDGKPGSITSTATTTNVTYVMTAPGGAWDVLDYGAYQSLRVQAK